MVSGGGFFSWGTKFKYTGRTEREVLEDSGTPSRQEPNVQRTSSMRRKASSVPATPSTPLQPHLGTYISTGGLDKVDKSHILKYVGQI